MRLFTNSRRKYNAFVLIGKGEDGIEVHGRALFWYVYGQHMFNPAAQ